MERKSQSLRVTGEVSRRLGLSHCFFLVVLSLGVGADRRAGASRITLYVKETHQVV